MNCRFLAEFSIFTKIEFCVLWSREVELQMLLEEVLL